MESCSKLFSICFSSLFLAGVAYAEIGDKPDTTLETVVVTATRTERREQLVPANVSVIDSKQIQQSGAQSVVELLRSQEGTTVRDILGNGKSASVDLRGFGESGPYNTLVLVDGRRVNEIDLSGVDWTQVPIEQIERIEIIRGAGTVLYGDNAVGGVINIITKSPREGFSAKASALAGSYSRHKEKISLSGGQGGLAGLISVAYESGDGYRENGELRATNAGGKLSYDVSESFSLSLKGNYHEDSYGLPGPLTEMEMAQDRRKSTSPDDGAETKDGYITFTSDMDFGRYGAITGDISYRNRTSDYDYAKYTFASESDSTTWSFTPRYILNNPIADFKNNLIGGVDFYRSSLDQDFFYGEPRSKTTVTEGDRTSIGVYLHDEFYIRKDLLLSAGARKEWVEFDLKQRDLTGFLSPLDDELTESEYAYTLGLTYLYKNDSSLFARVNRSLRFQLLDELIVSDYMNAKININKNLRPQRGQHIEIGAKHRFNNYLDGRLTFFRASITDEIFFNSINFTNENHPRTLHQGIEVGMKLEPARFLRLFGNYTYEEAKFDAAPYNGNNVPGVPRHRLNAGLEIHDLLEGLTFSTIYSHAAKSYAISDQSNSFQQASGYDTISATVYYRWRFISAFAGVNNLTDEKYSDYVVVGGFPTTLNYYPAPERNWIAGIEFTY